MPELFSRTNFQSKFVKWRLFWKKNIWKFLAKKIVARKFLGISNANSIRTATLFITNNRNCLLKLEEILFKFKKHSETNYLRKKSHFTQNSLLFCFKFRKVFFPGSNSISTRSLGASLMNCERKSRRKSKEFAFLILSSYRQGKIPGRILFEVLD